MPVRWQWRHRTGHAETSRPKPLDYFLPKSEQEPTPPEAPRTIIDAPKMNAEYIHDEPIVWLTDGELGMTYLDTDGVVGNSVDEAAWQPRRGNRPRMSQYPSAAQEGWRSRDGSRHDNVKTRRRSPSYESGSSAWGTGDRSGNYTPTAPLIAGLNGNDKGGFTIVAAPTFTYSPHNESKISSVHQDTQQPPVQQVTIPSTTTTTQTNTSGTNLEIAPLPVPQLNAALAVGTDTNQVLVTGTVASQAVSLASGSRIRIDFFASDDASTPLAEATGLGSTYVVIGDSDTADFRAVIDTSSAHSWIFAKAIYKSVTSEISTAVEVQEGTDSDGDGIYDEIETLAPSGDANGDGVLDSQQGSVTSLPASRDGKFIPSMPWVGPWAPSRSSESPRKWQRMLHVLSNDVPLHV